MLILNTHLRSGPRRHMIEIWWKEFKLSSSQETLMIEQPGSLRKVQKNGKNNEIKKNLGLILCDPESLLTSLNAQQLSNVIHQNMNYTCLLVLTHLEIICSSIQWSKCTHLLYHKYRELCSIHLLKGLFHLTSQQHQTCYLQCRRYWWTLHGQMGVHFLSFFRRTS